MPLKTTCIGAFPKPGHSRAEHWRPVESATGQARQFTYVAEQTEAPGEDAPDAAARRAVRDQVACGIFIPTDRDTTRPSNVSPRIASDCCLGKQLTGTGPEDVRQRIIDPGWRRATTVSSFMAYPFSSEIGVLNQRQDTQPSFSITKIQL